MCWERNCQNTKVVGDIVDCIWNICIPDYTRQFWGHFLKFIFLSCQDVDDVIRPDCRCPFSLLFHFSTISWWKMTIFTGTCRNSFAVISFVKSLTVTQRRPASTWPALVLRRSTTPSSTVPEQSTSAGTTWLMLSGQWHLRAFQSYKIGWMRPYLGSSLIKYITCSIRSFRVGSIRRILN